jgi:hypothetical protein
LCTAEIITALDVRWKPVRQQQQHRCVGGVHQDVAMCAGGLLDSSRVTETKNCVLARKKKQS